MLAPILLRRAALASASGGTPPVGPYYTVNSAIYHDITDAASAEAASRPHARRT